MTQNPPRCLLLPAESGELVFEPNPPPLNGEPVRLRWRTSGGRAALVYVSRDGDHERLLACARDGKIEIDWIDQESTYQFILRSAAPDQPVLKLLEVPRTAETAELRMEPDSASFYLRPYSHPLANKRKAGRKPLRLAEWREETVTCLGDPGHARNRLDHLRIDLRILALQRRLRPVITETPHHSTTCHPVGQFSARLVRHPTVPRRKRRCGGIRRATRFATIASCDRLQELFPPLGERWIAHHSGPLLSTHT